MDDKDIGVGGNNIVLRIEYKVCFYALKTEIGTVVLFSRR